MTYNLAEKVKELRAQRTASRIDFRIESLVYKFTCVHGPKGQGKTSTIVMLAHEIARRFGLPVVIVSQQLGLKLDVFGLHHFLSTEDFICQIRAIAQRAEETQNLDADGIELTLLNHRGCKVKEHDPDYVLLANNQWRKKEHCSEDALKNVLDYGRPCYTSENGVIIYRSIVILDEGNEFTGGDSASNPVVKLYTRFIQMMRHLRITLIEAVPHPNQNAPKVRIQVDAYIKCRWFPNLGYVKMSVDRSKEWKGQIGEPWGMTYRPQPYWRMFESHNLLTIRARSLNISAKHI